MELEKILNTNGGSLRHHSGMPFPNEVIIFNTQNKLIQDELCYDKNSLKEEHAALLGSFTDEQRNVYEKITDDVSKGE